MAYRIRCLVVGDAGVGKTCLVHLLCEKTVLKRSEPTVGCNCAVLSQGGRISTGRSFFVEIWDIAGSEQFKHSRNVFYDNFQGVILVYDVTNRQSFLNLQKWVAEILDRVEWHKLQGKVQRSGCHRSSSSKRLSSDIGSTELPFAKDPDPEPRRSLMEPVLRVIEESCMEYLGGPKIRYVREALLKVVMLLGGEAYSLSRKEGLIPQHDSVKSDCMPFVSLLKRLTVLCPVLIIGNKVDVLQKRKGRPTQSQEMHQREKRLITEETGVDFLDASATAESIEESLFSVFFAEAAKRVYRQVEGASKADGYRRHAYVSQSCRPRESQTRSSSTKDLACLESGIATGSSVTLTHALERPHRTLSSPMPTELVSDSILIDPSMAALPL